MDEIVSPDNRLFIHMGVDLTHDAILAMKGNLFTE